MATNYSCDRCANAIFHYFRDRNSIMIPYARTGIRTDKDAARNSEGTKVDLCDDCIKELRSFLGLEATQRIEE